MIILAVVLGWAGLAILTGLAFGALARVGGECDDKPWPVDNLDATAKALLHRDNRDQVPVPRTERRKVAR
jgi:hypothetical protein